MGIYTPSPTFYTMFARFGRQVTRAKFTTTRFYSDDTPRPRPPARKSRFLRDFGTAFTEGVAEGVTGFAAGEDNAHTDIETMEILDFCEIGYRLYIRGDNLLTLIEERLESGDDTFFATFEEGIDWKEIMELKKGDLDFLMKYTSKINEYNGSAIFENWGEVINHYEKGTTGWFDINYVLITLYRELDDDLVIGDTTVKNFLAAFSKIEGNEGPFLDVEFAPQEWRETLYRLKVSENELKSYKKRPMPCDNAIAIRDYEETPESSTDAASGWILKNATGMDIPVDGPGCYRVEMNKEAEK